jgi:hypothetical protein
MRQLLLTTCDGPVSTGAARVAGTGAGRLGLGNVTPATCGHATYGSVVGVHVERVMPTMWRDLPMDVPAADPIARFRFAKAPKARRPPRGSP